MYKTVKLIFKLLLPAVMVICLLLSVPLCTAAEGLYEYYFNPDINVTKEQNITDKYDEFLNSLPDEIKKQLPEDLYKGDIFDESQKIVNFKSIWHNVLTTLKNALLPSLKSLGIIVSVLIIGSLIRRFKVISNDGTDKLISTVINIGMVVIIIGTDTISIDAVDNFKNYICNIMNGLVPVLGIVYASSGNMSTAAIQSGGVILLITLCHNIFATILMPSVRICLLMGITNAAFPESGISQIATMLKNITVWIITSAVTLFSFILSLQNSIAQTADSIGMKSLKFAVGNLVPIIGGAISDSLGTVGGSLSLLKSAGGSIVIIILVILILPTIAGLVAKRLVIYLSKCIAAVLGCTTEAKLLDDVGGTVSMMLAFSVAISISFIYVVSLFVRSGLAITS